MELGWEEYYHHIISYHLDLLWGPSIRSSDALYKVKYRLNSTTIADDMVIKCNVKIVSFRFG